MEETTGAPGSLAVCLPRRLRASSRDGGGIVNRPPSSFSMLLSRHTRRREFILGGVAAAWPVVARAQQPKLPRIGVLVPSDPEPFWSEFRAGLREQGYIELQNI